MLANEIAVPALVVRSNRAAGATDAAEPAALVDASGGRVRHAADPDADDDETLAAADVVVGSGSDDSVMVEADGICAELVMAIGANIGRLVRDDDRTCARADVPANSPASSVLTSLSTVPGDAHPRHVPRREREPSRRDTRVCGHAGTRARRRAGARGVSGTTPLARAQRCETRYR